MDVGGGGGAAPARERWTKLVADFEASDLTQREFDEGGKQTLGRLAALCEAQAGQA